MSTDLAVIASQLPAHLRDNDTASDEFAGGLGASFPLAFLSIRGKEFRLRKDGQELNTRQRELSVVFIAARGAVSKRFYKDKYVSGSLEAPDCSSADGITPNVADPVSPKCATCPNNQWGSRITEGGKEGKACSDYKRIVIWPVGLSEEPLVLDVSATSLKAPKGQKHTVLMMGDYLTQLAKHGLDPTKVVTKIAFTDAEYPQLCFTFERLVGEDERARVLELRESDDVQTVLSEDMFEEGELEEDGDAPKTEKKAKSTRKARAPKQEKKEPEKPPIPDFPGEPVIMKEGDNLIIAQDETTWNKAWEEGFRPQNQGKAAASDAAPGKTKSAPAKEEAPDSSPASEPANAEEDEENGDGEESDLLNEVMKLLGNKG